MVKVDVASNCIEEGLAGTRTQPGVFSTDTLTVTQPRNIFVRRKESRSISYELIGCGLKGHRLVGGDVQNIDRNDSMIVREYDGMRWHRCLRCDAWLPRPLPINMPLDRLPDKHEITIPLRGKLLRDRYILRLIAINKFLHFLFGVIATLAVAYYALNRTQLHDNLINLLNSLRILLGEDTKVAQQKGVFSLLFQGINAQTRWVILFAIGIGAYSAIAAVEMIGLWYAKRWAEYLTLAATSIFLIPEIYELTESITVVKVLVFMINLAIIAYLLMAKRLFGIRGGVKAEEEEKALDVGWGALERVYP